MNRKRISFDYITLKIENSTEDMNIGTYQILEALGLASDDANIFTKKTETFYYYKQYGLDIKIKSREIVVEFHSTFFALYSFQLFKKLKNKIEEKFSKYARVMRCDIAQDFTQTSPEKFFPKCKRKIHIGFRHRFQEYGRDLNTGTVGTIYLKDANVNNCRWKLTVYNKTQELLDNLEKYSKQKFEFYRKLGYLDEKVTRFELQLTSDMCKNFYHEFEKSNCEVELCKKILNGYLKNHKIYSLKSGQNFIDKKSHKTWRKWDKLFNFKASKIEKPKIKKPIFKKARITDVEEIAEKIIANVLAYRVNPEELIEAIYVRKDQVIREAKLKQQRYIDTHNYFMKNS